MRVSEFREALAAGQVPPYWSGNLYGGYGSPVFLFYAPLFSLLAAARVGTVSFVLHPYVLGDKLVRNADAEVICETGETVTLGDEYLPRAADTDLWRSERPIEGPVVAATGPVRWETLANGGSAFELQVRAAVPARLRFARFAWPGWRAEVDGRPQPLAPSPRGALELDLPAGDARVRVWLEPAPLRRAALGLSLASLALWLGGLLASARLALPSSR